MTTMRRVWTQKEKTKGSDFQVIKQTSNRMELSQQSTIRDKENIESHQYSP